VLIHHLVDGNFERSAPSWLGRIFNAPIGVQLFLVLSGWLLGGQLLRALRRSGRIDVFRFWGRRWLRTLPAYYAVLALRVISGRNSLPEGAGMLVFTQNYLAPNAWQISWSLCVQEHFYLVLPLVLLVVARRPRLGIAVGLASLLVPALLRCTLSRSPGEWFEMVYAPTHMRLDALALGVLLAALSEGGGTVWTWCRKQGRALAVGGLATIAVIDFTPWFFGDTLASGFAFSIGTLGLSVGAALLIPAAVESNPQERRWWCAPVTWIADHAYVLYLLHTSVYSVVQAAAERLALPPLAIAVLMIAATACAAWILRATVERPALRVRDRLLASPKPVGPPPRATELRAQQRLGGVVQPPDAGAS